MTMYMKHMSPRTKQPLSLKWKWGILLATALIMLSSIGLIYYNRTVQVQLKQVAIEQAQEKLDAAVHFLTDINIRLEKRNFVYKNSDILVNEEEVREINTMQNFVRVLEADGETFLRIYNEYNLLAYETRTISSPLMKANQTVIESVVNDKPMFAGKAEIHDRKNRLLGTVEVMVVPQRLLTTFKYQNQKMNRLIIVLLCLAIIIAIIIALYLLRPLHYLINTLDLVEEENLNEIRVRQAKTTDEWSDLHLHINKLLDKVDSYVCNQKQFVEDVSHELRTPVAIVEGHLKMLNRWGKDDPDVLNESIAASLQEITRMKDLVQEMLDLSRAEHVDVDYKDEITDIYSTVRQVFNNFVMLYPHFNFFLESEKEGIELFVRIYKNHLEQILIILLDNAVKYSGERKEIHVSVSQNITSVMIAVQDFGEGMTPEDKERVFGRFYRVDKARTRERGGNGLGLSIAKQLVEGYKGQIHVESVLHNGSIFYIEFPVMNNNRDVYKKKLLERLKEHQLDN